jgi:hypothetical protein
MSGSMDSFLPLALILIPASLEPRSSRFRKGFAFAADGACRGARRFPRFGVDRDGQAAGIHPDWAGWGMDFSLKVTAPNELFSRGVRPVAGAALYRPFARCPSRAAGFQRRHVDRAGDGKRRADGGNLAAMLFFWQAMWAPYSS